jgi:hypothetical protein
MENGRKRERKERLKNAGNGEQSGYFEENETQGGVGSEHWCPDVILLRCYPSAALLPSSGTSISFSFSFSKQSHSIPDMSMDFGGPTH